MTCTSILVVCTANICRSPFAELFLRRCLHVEGVTSVEVVSAGTAALGGAQPHPLTAAELTLRGIDSASFTSRPVDRRVLSSSDLVLTMTRAHRGELLGREPGALRRTFTLREFATLVEHPSAGLADSFAGLVQAAYLARSSHPDAVNGDAADVADPYGGTREDFSEMARAIERDARTIARAIAQLSQPRPPALGAGAERVRPVQPLGEEERAVSSAAARSRSRRRGRLRRAAAR